MIGAPSRPIRVRSRARTKTRVCRSRRRFSCLDAIDARASPLASIDVARAPKDVVHEFAIDSKHQPVVFSSTNADANLAIVFARERSRSFALERHECDRDRDRSRSLDRSRRLRTPFVSLARARCKINVLIPFHRVRPKRRATASRERARSSARARAPGVDWRRPRGSLPRARARRAFPISRLASFDGRFRARLRTRTRDVRP